jgi:DNA-binding transcriptional LysR family regulator
MDKSNVTLDRMLTFVRVVERGSLSAVARELELGQSTVTRQLKELEEAVGVPLLSRTTRRVAITGEGLRYYTNCLNILRLVEQAQDEARSSHSAPAGNVRVSCTSAFGVMHLCRILFAFQRLHPEIGVDLNLTDERIDLPREGIDIAIRLGPLSDSSMKLRALGMSRRLLVASPEYLVSAGRPKVPDDVSTHEGIRMTNVAGSQILELLAPDGQHQVVQLQGRFRVDHGLAARQALAAGVGIAPAHRWLIEDLLSAGRLEVLLPGYGLTSVPLSMLIVPERAEVARVRLLVEFLAEQISAIPGIE